MEDIELKKCQKEWHPLQYGGLTSTTSRAPSLSAQNVMARRVHHGWCLSNITRVQQQATDAGPQHRRPRRRKTRKTDHAFTVETGVRILFIHTAIMLLVAQGTYTALPYV